MGDDLFRLTAAALNAKLHDGEITAEQLARACLARIAAREADVRAWSYVDPDTVIRQARELDKLPSRGPLHGIPVRARHRDAGMDRAASIERVVQVQRVPHAGIEQARLAGSAG